MTQLQINPAKLACGVAEKIATPQSQMFIHRITSLEQLSELWLIDGEAYQECNLPFDVFESWWRQYEPGMTQIRDGEGKLLASIGIFPISADQYHQFVNGAIAEAELLPVSLEECDNEPQTYWYFSGVVLIPELRGKKSAPLKLLLSIALGQWLASGHIDYPVCNCAMGYSSEGEAMLKRFEFSSITGSEQFPDNCPIYTMNQNSHTELLRVIKQRGL